MDVQGHERAVRIHADGRSQGLDGVGLAPAAAQVALAHIAPAHHGVEGQRIRQSRLPCRASQVHAAQLGGKIAQLLHRHRILAEGHGRFHIVDVGVEVAFLLVQGDDGLTLLGQLADAVRQGNDAQWPLADIMDAPHQGLALLRQAHIGDDRHAVHVAVLAPCLVGGGEGIQVGGDIAHGVALGGDGAQLVVIAPQVRQPAGPFPVRLLALGVDQHQLHLRVAVLGAELQQQALHIAHAHLIAGVNAQDARLLQREDEGRIRHGALLVLELLHGAAHHVLIQGEALAGIIDVHVHRQFRRAQAQIQEVAVLGDAAPHQRTLLLHHAGQAHVVRVGGKQVFLLLPADPGNPFLKGGQIRQVLRLTLFLLLLVPLVGVLAGDDGHHQAADEHAARHEQRGQRAHDAAAGQRHILQGGHRHHHRGHAHQRRGADGEDQGHFLIVGLVGGIFDLQLRRLALEGDAGAALEDQLLLLPRMRLLAARCTVLGHPAAEGLQPRGHRVGREQAAHSNAGAQEGHAQAEEIHHVARYDLPFTDSTAVEVGAVGAAIILQHDPPVVDADQRMGAADELAGVVDVALAVADGEGIVQRQLKHAHAACGLPGLGTEHEVALCAGCVGNHQQQSMGQRHAVRRAALVVQARPGRGISHPTVSLAVNIHQGTLGSRGVGMLQAEALFVVLRRVHRAQAMMFVIEI